MSRVSSLSSDGPIASRRPCRESASEASCTSRRDRSLRTHIENSTFHAHDEPRVLRLPSLLAVDQRALSRACVAQEHPQRPLHPSRSTSAARGRLLDLGSLSSQCPVELLFGLEELAVEFGFGKREERRKGWERRSTSRGRYGASVQRRVSSSSVSQEQVRREAAMPSRDRRRREMVNGGGCDSL